MKLLELLDLRDLNINQIEQRFEEIAKLLFRKCQIRKGKDIYDFLEIEFYYYIENHEDIITYPRNMKRGKWFFHDSGIDISFESKCDNINLSPKIRKPIKDYFGGILIRSLLKNGNEPITGPQKCTWSLFDYLDAFGNVDNNLPIIVECDIEKDSVVNKTNRYIPINEEKAKLRFENNHSVFTEHNEKLYRYYVKDAQWDEIKKSNYSARPW